MTGGLLGAGGSARRARAVALVCSAVVVAMVGLSYAAVPLYRLFCQVTGYGGTTKVADAPLEGAGTGRMMTVRFDANVAGGLAWTFHPAERQIEVEVGENVLAFYEVSSNSARRTTGTATFNVTPMAAGQYFNKVECFCFTEQSLDPGARADLPVAFFVDPEIENDPEVSSVSTITLSYTYFPAEPASDKQTSLDAAGPAGQATIN